MPTESRVKKSLLNARVNTICYFVALFVSFFTRKIFLDKLGTEFMGLSGTMQSLLGFLNIAELGIGSAIAYTLYKPLFEANREKINEIISVLGYLYRCIGLAILSAGIVLSLFLPWIFPHTSFSLGVIYFAFYAYLSSSLLGYFVNYKQCLLSADQRNYVVTGYYQITGTSMALIQMYLALTIQSFYLFLAIQIVGGVVNVIILQWKINRVYPWLASDVRLGRKLFKKYPEIGKYIRQLFCHKIGGFVQLQLSPFLIYAYVSLPMVALYGNYTLITQKIQSLLTGVLGSTGAGVGSLIAEGNQEKIYSIYKELLSFRVFIAGFFSICIYQLIGGFISVWLGEEYILSDTITFIVCLLFFLSIVREVTDQFLFGYGLFYDTWAPLVESCLFLMASLAFGCLWGLTGVLTGPLFSIFIVVYLWKPYFLYSKGFHKSIFQFWRELGVNLLLILIVILGIVLSYPLIYSSFVLENKWYNWIFCTIKLSLLTAIYLLLLFYSIKSDFRHFINRLLHV